MVWGDEYMIKLFASDLDGTLLNELHESDEVIFNSIQQVLNKNLYFTIATGRDLNGSLRNTGFETLPIYKICMNGAFIAAPNKEILYKKEIDKAFLKEILTQFPNIHFDCISRSDICSRNKEGIYTAFLFFKHLEKSSFLKGNFRRFHFFS